MTNDETNNLPSDANTSPEDAFALVGHEIRAGIFQVWGSQELDDLELTFSEIRERINSDVDPSQLHYHLNELVGHYIEKTENGYRLRSEGVRLNFILQAGTLDREQEGLLFDPGFDCHNCQSSVQGSFGSGLVVIGCPECGQKYGHDFLDTPISAFSNGDGEFLLSHFSNYIGRKSFSLNRNICPNCAHPLHPAFQPEDEPPAYLQTIVRYSCDLCGGTWRVGLGRALLAQPYLVSFCYEHGLEVLSTPYWELEFAATDEHLTVRDDDPWEVALEVPFDCETLQLVVDGDMNVIERNREGVPKDGNPELLRGIQIGYGLIHRRSNGDEPVLPDNAACLQTLRRHRWKDGVTCPHCESENTIKKGATNNNTKQYLCHNCQSIFNDLTGTVFAEHRLSLPEMFYLIGEMEEKDPTEIATQIDRSYQSILNFVQKIEQALLEQPSENPS